MRVTVDIFDSTTTPTTVELALLLDQSLGGVIRFLVQEAVEEASSAESKWLDAGEATVVDDESVVSSIVQTMGYGDAEKDKTTSALEPVETVQTVLSEIADCLRGHATK
ncbi:MAG: hypothetical protein V4479_07925 [Actinomycetota bacterium]